jgi:ribosomal protein L37AE/L43A
MQNVSCPSCGAPVEFKSHAAVMAVCEFCHATVVKDAASVRDIGKMSAVLEDYSRLQVGTAGNVGGHSFTVVGRIQLRYAAGMWNEWFLLFDDGSTGWLGDSSGMYVVTTARELGAAWPDFDQVRAGQEYDFGIGRYTASERRVADCIGGQGELPFTVGAGWQARVADFRSEAGFATLDYSDGDKPVLYAGTAVTLEEMRCQLLRDDEQIKESAGLYRGRVASLECPSCGTAIAYLPGLASNIVCQNCHAQLDAASPHVQVLAKGEEAARVSFTIPLGSTASVGGKEYRAIGAMLRRDDEGSSWTEYLLYSASADFFWLVETEDGWSRAQVMHHWPKPATPGAPEVAAEKARFRREYGYTARVDYAAGAFNWRVAAGDTVQVAEFAQGQTRLAAEFTADELTWSRSTPVAFDQVRAWFAIHPKAGAGKAKVQLPDGLPILDGSDSAYPRSAAKKFMIAILLLNLIPLVLNFSGSLVWVLLGVGAVYLPSLLLDSGGSQG